MTNAKRGHSSRLARLLRSWGWNRTSSRNGIRHRIYDLAACNTPWYDWGHRVLILVGDDFGGNWSEPEPTTWYYRESKSKRMWRTNYPQTTFEVLKTYDEHRAAVAGLDEHSDAFMEWKAICTNQDGDMMLGRQYWGGNFYGLSSREQDLLRDWLRAAHRHNWWGLRSWLYTQALHDAVHTRKPFACQEAPEPGTGGYSHWHCPLKRRHTGPHRYAAMAWTTGEHVYRFEENA